MEVTATHLPGILIIEPRIFEDERGYFFESFNQQVFNKIVGHTVAFVQDNHSRSAKGVLRGLHYQIEPYTQGKLIHVVEGEAFDVAVDIRESSPTFGQWIGVNLSAENKKQLWIPQGFAHGFLALSEPTQVVYKTTTYWRKEAERSVLWSDPDIAIAWPLSGAPILSTKDKFAARLLK